MRAMKNTTLPAGHAERARHELPQAGRRRLLSGQSSRRLALLLTLRLVAPGKHRRHVHVRHLPRVPRLALSPREERVDR
jgi:hypothetical protein